MAIAGVIVIREHVDRRGTIARFQCPSSKIQIGSGKPAENGLSIRIGPVDRFCGSLEKPTVIFGIGYRIPIFNVGLVPDLVVFNSAFEVIDHPGHVLCEGMDLVLSFGWPEDGIEASIGIVKAAWHRSDDPRQASGGRSVEWIAVEQLKLDVYAVFDK